MSFVRSRTAAPQPQNSYHQLWPVHLQFL